MNDSQTYNPSPVNHAMLFGVELGIWFGLNFITSAMAQGRAWMGALSWLIMFYIIYGVFRSALHYKQNECDGHITYWQSFQYIMWLFFFASIIAAAVKVVYLKWINPDFMAVLYQQTKPIVDALAISDADKNQAMLSMERLLQPVRFSLYYIIYDMIMGVVLALILSLFVRKNRKI